MSIFKFLAGIVQDGADEFGDEEEFFDVIGQMLLEAAAEKEEEDIKDICDRLYHVMKK